MTTITKTKQTLETLGNKLDANGITTLEAGAMQTIHKTSGTMTATYQVMYSSGILPTDYISHKNKESTASAEQYAERKRVAAMICYTKAERASLAAKLPSDATDAQKASRKKLQDRATELLKTIRRGLVTQDKLANPQEAKANERKTAFESLQAKVAECIKLMQGDRPFPDDFDHDTAVATLIGYQNKFLK